MEGTKFEVEWALFELERTQFEVKGTQFEVEWALFELEGT